MHLENSKPAIQTHPLSLSPKTWQLSSRLFSYNNKQLICILTRAQKGEMIKGELGVKWGDVASCGLDLYWSIQIVDQTERQKKSGCRAITSFSVWISSFMLLPCLLCTVIATKDSYVHARTRVHTRVLLHKHDTFTTLTLLHKNKTSSFHTQDSTHTQRPNLLSVAHSCTLNQP